MGHPKSPVSQVHCDRLLKWVALVSAERLDQPSHARRAQEDLSRGPASLWWSQPPQPQEPCGGISN